MVDDGWVHEGRARIPRWLARLDAAVWVVDAGGLLTFCNARAAALLGAVPGDLGRPCRGTLACPHGDCGTCANRQALREGKPMLPFLLSPPENARHTLVVLPLPLAAPGEEPCLVHVGLRLDAARRIERYWQGVVAAAGGASPEELTPEPLSRREAEVLERLSSGLDQKAVARELHVSYATVRNHVQRILRKLRVHSLQAAIGMHLLRGCGTMDRPGATPAPAPSPAPGGAREGSPRRSQVRKPRRPSPRRSARGRRRGRGG